MMIKVGCDDGRERTETENRNVDERGDDKIDERRVEPKSNDRSEVGGLSS